MKTFQSEVSLNQVDPIRKIKGNYAWSHSTVQLTLSLRVFTTALGFVF